MVLYRIRASVDQSEIIEIWISGARGISEAIDMAVQRYAAMGYEAIDVYEARRFEKGENNDTFRTI